MDQTIKIAVSGTHSIGKTTLVNWISQKFGLYPIGEQARSLLESDFKFHEVDSDLNIFMTFQQQIILNQIKEEQWNHSKSFVVDRTPLDSLAYVLERFRRINLVEQYDWFVTNYMSLVWSYLERTKYDVVFWLKYHPDFGDDDGNRNLKTMENIDIILSDLYSSYSLRFPSVQLVEIRTPMLEERKEIVQAIVEDL